jgi:hypothetical protein
MIAPLAKKFPMLTNSPTLFARGWSLWLPFLAAGIKIDNISHDFRDIQVSMKLTLRNTNYVGTHFGGSLYAMTDPFYMIMLIKNLGRDYIVWDKAAEINFKKPGRGKVSAEFHLEQKDIDDILAAVEADERKSTLWKKEVLIKDEQGEIITRVMKTLYVKKK